MIDTNPSYIKIKTHLTEKEVLFLERINIDVGKAMVKVIKHYIKKEEMQYAAENFGREGGVRINKINQIKEILDNYLIKTSMKEDYILLKDLYSIYSEEIISENKIPLSRQRFRKEAEKQNYLFTSIGGKGVGVIGVRFKRMETIVDKTLEMYLVRTSNYQDTLDLKNIYGKYTHNCALNDVSPYTKQKLRRGLEGRGYDYAKVGGNRMAFRFVRLKTNEDEEWEL
jgi:hypothetical protein